MPNIGQEAKVDAEGLFSQIFIQQHCISSQEAIAEVKDSKQLLFLQYLDAKKAFDVVRHTGLLCSLYQQGVALSCPATLYTNISSSVKWQGKLSKALQDYQGLRQGGDTSADTFKNKTNAVLNELEASSEGY